MNFSPKTFARAFAKRDQTHLAELMMVDTALKSGLKKLLSNPKDNIAAKAAMAKAVLGESVSAETLQFLIYLTSENYLKYFAKIVAEYRHILENESKVQTGEIVTAKSISDEEKKAIEERISQKIGVPVLLKASTNPKILGGVILKVGDQTIDRSWSRRLKALR